MTKAPAKPKDPAGYPTRRQLLVWSQQHLQDSERFKREILTLIGPTSARPLVPQIDRLLKLAVGHAYAAAHFEADLVGNRCRDADVHRLHRALAQAADTRE